MEKPCQRMLNLLEVLNQMKSLGAEGAHRAQRIMNDVAGGRKSVEDALREADNEVKRIKISTF